MWTAIVYIGKVVMYICTVIVYLCTAIVYICTTIVYICTLIVYICTVIVYIWTAIVHPQSVHLYSYSVHLYSNSVHLYINSAQLYSIIQLHWVRGYRHRPTDRQTLLHFEYINLLWILMIRISNVELTLVQFETDMVVASQLRSPILFPFSIERFTFRIY